IQREDKATRREPVAPAGVHLRGRVRLRQCPALVLRRQRGRGMSDDIESRIRAKNALLLDLETAKAAKATRTIVGVASRAAALERTIARAFMDDHQVGDAIINL